MTTMMVPKINHKKTRAHNRRRCRSLRHRKNAINVNQKKKKNYGFNGKTSSNYVSSVEFTRGHTPAQWTHTLLCALPKKRMSEKLYSAQHAPHTTNKQIHVNAERIHAKHNINNSNWITTIAIVCVCDVNANKINRNANIWATLWFLRLHLLFACIDQRSMISFFFPSPILLRLQSKK